MPSKRKNTDASTRKLTLRKKPTQLSTPCDLTPTESSQQTSFTSLLKMKLDKVRSTHKSDDDFEEVGQSFEGKEVPKSGGKIAKRRKKTPPKSSLRDLNRNLTQMVEGNNSSEEFIVEQTPKRKRQSNDTIETAGNEK